MLMCLFEDGDGDEDEGVGNGLTSGLTVGLTVGLTLLFNFGLPPNFPMSRHC